MHLLQISATSLVSTQIKSHSISKTHTPHSKSPPGPWKLPLIGHLHHLSVGLPHHSLRDLANKHGPLLLLRLGEIDTMVVSSPRVAKEVLRTQDAFFADRPEFLAADVFSLNNAGLSCTRYSDHWKQMRKICMTELLSPQKVKSMWSIREVEVSRMITNISSMARSGNPTNLSKSLVTLTSNIISRAAFGKKCRDKDVFASLMLEVISLAGGFDFADMFPSLKFLHGISGTKAKLQKIQPQVDKILENIINEHKEKRTRVPSHTLEHEEDIVDVFLRLQEENSFAIPIRTHNIKAILLDIFSGGSETAATTTIWAMAELMRNPKVMEKAQEEVRRVFNVKTEISQSDFDELKYLHLVIKETLRLHPPIALLLPRECRESCVVEGYEIRKGTKVLVNAWAIGRDPDLWVNAEKFEPERFQDLCIDYTGTNCSYIPFGSGRRVCPGMSFGLANVELALAQLIYHFDWAVPGADELDMSESFGMSINRKFALNLVPTIYSPKTDQYK